MLAYSPPAGADTSRYDRLTDVQLVALWHRIWERIPDGGRYGWDWPTLSATYPAYARAMRSIKLSMQIRRL